MRIHRLYLILTTLSIFALTANSAFAETYASSKYGFSFDSPEGYTVDAESDYYFDIRGAKGKLVLTGNVEDAKLYPRYLYEDRPDPFRGFGTWRALLRCDADGPDGSAYCPSIESAEEFRTQNGLRAIELMLTHVQEIFGDNPTEEVTVTGPLYLVDISREGQTVVLMLGVLPWQSMTREEKSLALSILDTLNLKNQPE